MQQQQQQLSHSADSEGDTLPDMAGVNISAVSS